MSFFFKSFQDFLWIFFHDGKAEIFAFHVSLLCLISCHFWSWELHHWIHCHFYYVCTHMVIVRQCFVMRQHVMCSESCDFGRHFHDAAGKIDSCTQSFGKAEPQGGHSNYFWRGCASRNPEMGVLRAGLQAQNIGSLELQKPWNRSIGGLRSGLKPQNTWTLELPKTYGNPLFWILFWIWGCKARLELSLIRSED